MNAPSLRIVLVDDDEEDRQLIRWALTSAINHLVIEEMSTGEELINWLAQQRSQPSAKSRNDHSLVTIILLDMHMPKLTGLETLQYVGDMRDLPYMPVVMLTSSMEEPLKQRAYEQGIHLYMVKPAESRGFYRIVEAVKLCYRDTIRMRDELQKL